MADARTVVPAQAGRPWRRSPRRRSPPRTLDAPRSCLAGVPEPRPIGGEGSELASWASSAPSTLSPPSIGNASEGPSSGLAELPPGKQARDAQAIPQEEGHDHPDPAHE
jgi:hypothetical protein